MATSESGGSLPVATDADGPAQLVDRLVKYGEQLNAMIQQGQARAKKQGNDIQKANDDNGLDMALVAKYYDDFTDKLPSRTMLQDSPTGDDFVDYITSVRNGREGDFWEHYSK